MKVQNKIAQLVLCEMSYVVFFDSLALILSSPYVTVAQYYVVNYTVQFAFYIVFTLYFSKIFRYSKRDKATIEKVELSSLYIPATVLICADILAIFLREGVYVLKQLIFGVHITVSTPGVYTIESAILDAPGVLITCLLGPMFEELIYRKYIYGSLRHDYSMSISMFTSSLMFALVHGSLDRVFYTFVFGCLACYLYEHFSMSASILAHIIGNSLSIISMIAPISIIYLASAIICIIVVWTIITKIIPTLYRNKQQYKENIRCFLKSVKELPKKVPLRFVIGISSMVLIRFVYHDVILEIIHRL